MKPAEYPERTCREPVASELLMYSCELADLHEGPCASYSSAQSVRARESWERRQAAPEQAPAPAAVQTKPKTARTRRRRNA